MNEMIQPPTPEFEEKMRAANRTPEANPAFVAQLRTQLLTRSIEMKPSRPFFMQPTWIYALVVLLVLLLTGFVVGPQRVLAAMHALFGYVPGMGMVSQDAPIRGLAQPVSMTRDGITISVQQAVWDATHTVIIYQVDGLPAESQFFGLPGLDNAPASCDKIPELRLPDGRKLEATQLDGSRGWASGYSERLSYAALPANLNDSVLFVPCISATLTGKAPENWEIPIHFVPAPPQMTVYPVFDVATPTSTPSPSAPTPQVSPTTSGQLVYPYGISLALEHVVPLDDGYLMQASLHVSGDALFISPHPGNTQVRVLDANGQEIDSTDASADLPYSPDTHTYAIHYKTAPVYTTGPLTISLDSVLVDLNTKATFVFDPGKDPKIGQTWQINKDVDVQGYHLHVLSATMTSQSAGKTGLSFEMETTSTVFSATLQDADRPFVGGGGGDAGLDGDKKKFNWGFDYAAGTIPTGPINVLVTSITTRLQGPWQVTWTPPTGSEKRWATPTAQSASACQPLTIDVWNHALAHPAPFPAGLTGKLSFDSWIVNGETTPWNAAIANVDGSNIQRLGEGSSAAFSPDGTHVVVRFVALGQSSLTLIDLATGVRTPLPNTIHVLSPIWSPDGKQLAYLSRQAPETAPFDLFVMNLDGSNTWQVTNTPEQKYLVGWTPDGSGLIFQQDGPNGNELLALDLLTRETKTIFGPDPHIFNYALSPDGKRIAANERRFGDNDDQLYIFDLDGSHRRLLANLKPSTVSEPAWSPDGKWLALTITPDEKPGESLIPTIALMEVDTCQVIPLPGLQGNINSWGP